MTALRPPSIVLVAGGVGGSRFALGVREAARRRWPDGHGGTDARITIVANTGDDMWLAGLRITPDLDSITYALADVADTDRGWGRRDESERVSAELTAFGVGWPWFTLGDLDLGTHIARSSWLRDGLPLSEAVRRITARWGIPETVLPATEDEVPTHVVIDDAEPDGIHFEEWWVRLRAGRPALRFVQRDVEQASPGRGVIEAIADADVVVIAPSNPVVSIGTVLGFSGTRGGVPGIPGLRRAVRGTAAPVVGVSPIIAGSAVRGMAGACLQGVGVETDAGAVARAHGSRASDGILDAWLVDTADATADVGPGIRRHVRPLWFRDADETAAIAGDALDLGLALHRLRP